MKPMARPKTHSDDSVAARVEHALTVSGGRLKLWLVFESDTDVRAARALITERKARHLTALSRVDLEKRHDKVYREIAERYGETAGPEPETPPPDTTPKPSPAPRKKNGVHHSPVA
jgi:hypothetical protein